MDTATITTSASDRDVARAGETFTQLVFIARAGTLELPTSSHSLDGLDEVRFRRGERAVERRGRGLVLAFPDGRMSAEHGRLVRHGARWVLDDPASKNGSIVDGELQRRTVLRDGAVLELGHSFFLFRQRPVQPLPGGLAGDVEAARLAGLPDGMQTFSPVLAHEVETLARLAPSTVSIVLCGATGTGKEVVARGIHTLSGRPGEMVAVNCGALPATLIEAELFGHRRGAFSGATADRRGLVRSADRGTLFLDEVGELPAASQTALLRVLQEREVAPVGEDRPIRVDIRVIAATLRDLDVAIADGRFRADLYARLAGHVGMLPTLAQRREDLGLLIAALARRHANGRAIALAPGALRAMLRHAWPLNIRELEQALASAIAIAPAGHLELEHLPAAVREQRRAVAPIAPQAPIDSLDEDDRELRARLVALFEQHAGNVAAVAGALGKQRQQIYKWIKRLEIDLTAFRGEG